MSGSSFKLFIYLFKEVNTSKSLFSCGGERAIECDFDDFTQNGCYGNQSHLFKVLFYSIVPDRLKNKI